MAKHEINGAIATSVAQLVMKLAEQAVFAGAKDVGGGAGIAMSAIAGPLMMGAGMLSKRFADQPDDGMTMHPANYASPDAILVFCLLLSRSLQSDHNCGVSLHVTPDVYLAVFDDFAKLSATPIADVVRDDLIQNVTATATSASASVEALLARLQAPSADKLN